MAQIAGRGAVGIWKQEKVHLNHVNYIYFRIPSTTVDLVFLKFRT
jgi:hypothetical protein